MIKICLVRRLQEHGSCAGTGPGLRFIYPIIETSFKVFKTDQNCIPLALSSSSLSLSSLSSGHLQLSVGSLAVCHLWGIHPPKPKPLKPFLRELQTCLCRHTKHTLLFPIIENTHHAASPFAPLSNSEWNPTPNPCKTPANRFSVASSWLQKVQGTRRAVAPSGRELILNVSWCTKISLRCVCVCKHESQSAIDSRWTQVGRCH